MATPVITDIQMENEKDLTLQRVNAEKDRLLDLKLQRANAELKLSKSRAQNYRILTAPVKATGKTATAIAEFVVGATGFGIEFGTAVYNEYMPSSQQIFHWFGKKLEATSTAVSEISLTSMIPELPQLPELPEVPALPWQDTISC